MASTFLATKNTLGIVGDAKKISVNNFLKPIYELSNLNPILNRLLPESSHVSTLAGITLQNILNSQTWERTTFPLLSQQIPQTKQAFSVDAISVGP